MNTQLPTCPRTFLTVNGSGGTTASRDACPRFGRLARWSVGALVALSLCFLGGPLSAPNAFGGPGASGGSSAAAGKMTKTWQPAQLSKRFAASMASTQRLKMRVTIEQRSRSVRPGMPDAIVKRSVRVHTDMAPKRIRSDVYGDDGALVSSVAFDGQRVQEHHAEFTFGDNRSVDTPIFEYAAPTPHGAKNIYLTTGDGCLYGSLLSTWVGDEGTHMTSALTRKIARAESITEDEFLGIDCLRVVSARRFADPDTGDKEAFVETLYLCRQRLLPIGFDGVQSGPWGEIHRTRRYDILAVNEACESPRWRIDLDRDAGLQWATVEAMETAKPAAGLVQLD